MKNCQRILENYILLKAMKILSHFPLRFICMKTEEIDENLLLRKEYS
jgi:hypothetical protein